uniref:Uncharacterized protein n=1 Tax=Ciona savignyi TaxID=51511 RepID=H2YE06_CIOSA
MNAQQPPPRPGIPRSRPGQMVNSFNPMSLFAPDIQDPVGIAGQEDLLSDEVINSLLLPKPLHLNKDQKYQAQSVVALMLKATRSMHQSAAKLQFLKPVDHEKTMTNLKAMPMYRHMKEDSLRMIVLELQIRQQQQRANAEKDFKTSKMQLSWLESRYRKTVQDAANLNGMIALAKAAANGPN